MTLMDLAAMFWLIKIDTRLLDKIEVEYTVQIKAGKRLCELVPEIAKSIPNILKRMDGVRKEVFAAIQDLDVNDEEVVDEQSVNTKVFKISSRGQRRGGFHGAAPGRGRRFQQSSSRPPIGLKSTKPTCAHCGWLRSFWKISEIDPHHRTEDCMRKISKDVRAIIEENVLDQEASEEDDPSDDSQGQSKQNLLNNNNMSFQQSEIKKKKPVLQHVKPKEENEEINYSIHLLSDESLNKLKVRAVRLLRKASSPKILVTKENLKLVMLVDEGSEINCLDADLASKMGVRLEPTKNMAKSAGNKDLSIVGQTIDDLVVDTLFNSTHVPMNLGRATVIQNL